MEAVPRLPMLQFPPKVSSEETGIGSRIEEYIVTYYQESPITYRTEIYEFETLRKSAINASVDVNGCSTLKRYYCQLRSLSSRMQLYDEKNSNLFSWSKGFQTYASESGNISFEMNCIMYNIGALHMALGATDSRTTPDGMKMSCTHFQCAAWAFQSLAEGGKEDFNYSPFLMNFMTNLALSQAQECILEKSMTDSRKPHIIAKVSMQVVEYLKASSDFLASYKKTEQSHNDNMKFVKLWQKHIDFKVAYYNAVTYFYQGIQNEEQQKFGEKIAYFQAAVEKLEESMKLAKSMDKIEDVWKKMIGEALTFANDVIKGKLTASEKENEYVYHEKVPPISSLHEVKGASLVKCIPFSFTDAEVAGKDLFSRLVPMQAHLASSTYSEEKAKLLREVSAKIQEKNEELETYLLSMQLESFTVEESLDAMPHELIECCADMNARNGNKELTDAVSLISNAQLDVERKIREASALMEEEEKSEKEFHAIVGTKISPNQILNELKREVKKCWEAHETAHEMNKTLHGAIASHKEQINTLSMPLENLMAMLPSVSTIEGDEDKSMRQEIQRLMKKVREMQAQRLEFENQLRHNLHQDDITKELIIAGELEVNEPDAEFLQEQLKKHSKVLAFLDQNMAAQMNILTALSEANAAYAETRQKVNQAKTQRNDIICSLISSYQAFTSIIQKADDAKGFYGKLDSQLNKAISRIKSLSKVQEEQRTEKLNANVKKFKKVKTETVSGPKLKDYLAAGISGHATGVSGHSSGMSSHPIGMPAHASYDPRSNPPFDPARHIAPGADKNTYPGMSTQLPSAPSTYSAYSPDPKGLMQQYSATPRNFSSYSYGTGMQSDKGMQPISSTLTSPSASQSNLTANDTPTTTSSNQPNYSAQQYSGYMQNQAYASYYQQGNISSQEAAGSSAAPQASTIPQTVAQNQVVNPQSYPHYQKPSGGQQSGIPQPIVDPKQSVVSPHDSPSRQMQQSNQSQQPYGSYNNQQFIAQQQNQSVRQNVPTTQHPSTGTQNVQTWGQYPNTAVTVQNTVSQPVSTTGSQSTSYNPDGAASQQPYGTGTLPYMQNSPYGHAQYPNSRNHTAYPYQGQTYNLSGYNNFPNWSQTNTSTQAYSSAYSPMPSCSSSMSSGYSNKNTNSQNSYQYQNYPTSTTPQLNNQQSAQFSQSTSSPATTVGQTPASIQAYGQHPQQPYSQTNISYPQSQSVTKSQVPSQPKQNNPNVSQGYNSSKTGYSNYAHMPHPQQPVPGQVMANNSQQSYSSQQGMQNTSQQSYPPQQGMHNTSQQSYPPQTGMHNTAQQAYPPQQSIQSHQSYPPQHGQSYQLQQGLPNASQQAFSSQQIAPNISQQPGIGQQCSGNVPLPTQGAPNMLQHISSQQGMQTVSQPSYQPQQSMSAVTQSSYPPKQSLPTQPSHNPQQNMSTATQQSYPLQQNIPTVTQQQSYPPQQNIPTVTQQQSYPPQQNIPTVTQPSYPPQQRTSIASQPLYPTQQSIPNSSQNSAVTTPSKVSNLDLLSGIEITNSQWKPLEPQQPYASDKEDTDNVEDETDTPQAPVSQSTDESILAKLAQQPKRSVSVYDPLADDSVLDTLAAETDRLSKFILNLDKRSLNGPTNLEIKWKELATTLEQYCSAMKISVSRCYPLKNRFPDLLPFDDTRVILSSARDDYINASYVQLKSVKDSVPFILTQAPMPNTLVDFWNMVFEEQVEIIICLNAEAEVKGQVYYPLEESAEFGCFSVTVKQTNEAPNKSWKRRTLSVINQETKVSRIVLHFQYTSWPPSGMPESPSQLLQFVGEFQTLQKQQRNKLKPVVVHCVSGTGRSGVFVVLSAFIRHIIANGSIVDVWNLVLELCYCRRMGILDKYHLLFLYSSALYYVQDALMKRGILTDKATFDENPRVKSHARHPSADLLSSDLSKIKANLGFENVDESAMNNESDLQRTASQSSILSTGSVKSSLSQYENSPSISPSHKQLQIGEVTVPPSLLSSLDPDQLTLEASSSQSKPAKQNFEESGLTAVDSNDPLSSLDPMWTLKKC